jgi:hypothetical protein
VGLPVSRRRPRVGEAAGGWVRQPGGGAEGASEQAGPAGAGRPFGVDDVGKLRWLLGKATAELGEVRPAEVSPQQVCAWRLRVPKGTASKRRRHSDRC